MSSGNTKYLADTINVKQLLYWAMPKLLLRSPLSDQEKKYVDRDMALSATKATFYVGNEAVHTIYVGNSTQDNQATYMYYPGTDRPCIVEIPGFNGYLTPYFNTNIQLWRSVQLIETDPSNIVELSVRWNLEPQHSFTIKQNDGLLSLFDVSGKPISCKKGLLAGYLFLCKDFAREAGEPAGINFDKKASGSLLASTPLISFDYTLQDKTKTTIHVYPMQEGAETVGINVTQNKTELQQTGLFWVKSNNDPYIWMTQDIILKNRMKKLTDFIN